MTPGEMMAEALRECCEDVKGLGICSHPESCPSCRIFKALAAHASREYTEVVTERLREWIKRIVQDEPFKAPSETEVDLIMACLSAKAGSGG